MTVDIKIPSINIVSERRWKMITLDKAKKALEASEKKARELGITVSTAIVDDYGVLIAFSKMDGALHISPKFSKAKARTSAAFGLPSGNIASYAGEGKPYFGINTAFGGKLMIMEGGIPVKINGKVVGAVGVGGSTDVSQDTLCAQEAAKIIE